MKKKFLAAAIGAMLIGGSASAVQLSAGEKGDLLISPLYMAGGGWDSEVKVINTSATDSVVAKVTTLSFDNSRELRDFLIYLSPGDVWTGKLATSGSDVVWSSDDGSYVEAESGDGCPSPTGSGNKLNVALTQPYTVGYINIMQAHSFANTLPTPFSKATLAKMYYDACVAARTTGVSTVTQDVMTGSVKLTNATSGAQMGLPLTVLSGYRNNRWINNRDYTSLGDVTAFTSKGAVEDALWSSSYAVPYDMAAGMTMVTATFPTKEQALWPNTSNTGYVPFQALRSPTVSYVVRDEEERQLGKQGCVFSPCDTVKNSLLPTEISWVTVVPGSGEAVSNLIYAGDFKKGWIDMNIEGNLSPIVGTTGARVAGTKVGSPAIVTTFSWQDIGSGKQRAVWQYAARSVHAR